MKVEQRETDTHRSFEMLLYEFSINHILEHPCGLWAGDGK